MGIDRGGDYLPGLLPVEGGLHARDGGRRVGVAVEGHDLCVCVCVFWSQ